MTRARRGRRDRGPLLALYETVAQSDDPSCILSDTLKIVRVNPAWTRFAAANDGADVLARWGRGAQLLDAISAELRPFYRDLFARTLASGERLEHDYECSSPTVFRTFRMIAYQVHPFLVVTHSLRVEVPHDRPAMAADAATYAHGGIIRMCATCRRTQRAATAQHWDWVPDYVARMPRNVSHGLCPTCARVYYPEFA